MRRILLTLALSVGVATVLHVLLSRWLHHELRERIAEAAASCGAEWVARERSQLRFDLLAGDLRLVDVRWERKGEPIPTAPAVSGRLDSVIVSGLSYRAVLFNDRVDVARLVLHATDLDIALPRDTMPRSRDGDRTRFKVGELDIRLHNVITGLADPARLQLADLELSGEQVLLDLVDTVFHAGRLDGTIAGLRYAPFSDSTLAVDRVMLSEAGEGLTLEGIRFGPAAVMRHAVNVRQERDVIAGEVEHVRLSGIEPSMLLRGIPRLRTLRIGPSQLRVARDKHRPDQAFKHKPLPARMLRELPLGAGCDSLVLEALSVQYFERVDPGRGFARIPFDSIRGVLTNVRHRQEDTLHLHATAFAFGATPVSLDLRSHVGDSTDHIIVEAHVGRMAFSALSDVLVPLTGIATPEGRIDTLILRMNGRDRRATAQCWMRYDGLRLSRGKKRTGDRARITDPVFDGLLNAVVRSHRTGRRRNEGWMSYTWDRRRDRAIFNYLWAGAREGAKACMLPPVVEKVTKHKR
ncbi:MAG: hypothetical protein KF797_02625 [Flavobacteriales bacterium]|nr:hypothetical protein [Flavobacteriales bacterium]